MREGKLPRHPLFDPASMYSRMRNSVPEVLARLQDSSRKPMLSAWTKPSEEQRPWL
jgi:hypothetical protein